MDKKLKISVLSLLFHMTYSAYHIMFGLTTHSWWALTVGIYYFILSIVRIQSRIILILGKETDSNNIYEKHQVLQLDVFCIYFNAVY